MNLAALLAYRWMGDAWNETRRLSFEHGAATFCTVPLKTDWHDGVVVYDVAWAGQIIRREDGSEITAEDLRGGTDTAYLCEVAAIKGCMATRELARSSGAEVE